MFFQIDCQIRGRGGKNVIRVTFGICREWLMRNDCRQACVDDSGRPMAAVLCWTAALSRLGNRSYMDCRFVATRESLLQFLLRAAGLIVANSFQRGWHDADLFLQHDLGLMDVVALHEVHAQLKQYRHGIGVLNPFRDRCDAALFGCCRQ